MLMAVAFFVSTNGLVLATHTCLKDTHRQVSLFTSGSCCKSDGDCGNPRTGNSVVQSCCVTEYNLHKTHTETTLPGQHGTTVTFLIPFVAMLPSVALPLSSFDRGYIHAARAPDPLSGRILLHSIHRLLV